MKSNSQKLTFINANYKNLAYDSLLDDLYQETFKYTFLKETGVYVNQDNIVAGTKFKIDYEKSVPQNVKAFESYLKTLGVTVEEFKLFKNASHLYRDYFFRKNENHYTTSGTANSAVIHFVKFLVNGYFDDDLALTHELMDQSGIKYNTGAWKLELGNVTIKAYMNGRLDLKGLTESQQKIIDSLFEIQRKLK